MKSRLTFSTRTLLVAVSLLAIFCAYFGARTVREVRERFALAEITRIGGRFDYSGSILLKNDGWVTRAIAYFTTEDFTRVTHVSLDGTTLADDNLIILKSLPNLEGLDASSTKLTDSAVDTLATLRNLKYVNLAKTKISQNGLTELKKRRPNLTVDWQ